jgi:predicted nucleic acid-binding protein
VPGIVYDSGALVAAERRDARFVTMHERFASAGIRPIVPVVVLAQAWRGGPQHQISRVLKGCDVRPVDEKTARTAGTICGLAKTSAVVDSIVVTMAARLQAGVVTSDPGDLGRLAEALGIELDMLTV